MTPQICLEKETKCSIYDIFYHKQMVTRSGGGTLKNKMCRRMVSVDVTETFQKKLAGDKKLLEYFNKLKNRNPSIAPPPRPLV